MKISVIGAAGYVGSNVAFTLAMQGLADEIVLIDPYKPNIVTHLAMDASTGVADKGVVLRAGEYDEMKDSNIVIISAGAAQGLIASRMEMLPKNLPIIKEIAGNIVKFCPDAIVITATNPVDPLNYAMYLCTGFDRHKVIGYSTNDSTRFRMMVAQLLGHDTGEVEGFVMGEHGESQVLIFSSVRIKGKTVNLDENAKQKIRSQIPDILRTYEELKTGRTAGITSATGMRRVVQAIVNNTHETIPCSAVLSGEYGLHNISMGVPLVIGSNGIHKVKELSLAEDEQTALKGTLDVLQPTMRQVEEFLGISRED
jgi:malate/lactate dehydrogenase